MSLLLVAGLPAHAQLDILLTNDDGFGEPGIEALKTRLRAAGHTVTVGAPDGNASTASVSLDATRPFYQVDCSDAQFPYPECQAQSVCECKVRSVCVPGETPPEDCTLLEDLGPSTPVASVAATSAFLEKDPGDFDLVVSGINSGTNLGPEVQFSGTVGAAIAAISKVGADVPGIAVSTVSDPTDPGDPTDPAYLELLDDIADFIVVLIAHLEDARKHPSHKLLPDGVGLNVNYPDLAPEDVAGVMLTVQDRVLKIPGTDEALVLRAFPFPPLEDENVFVPGRTTISSDDRSRPKADTTAFNKGFITITPIESDYTASWYARIKVKRLLRGLLWGYHRYH